MAKNSRQERIDGYVNGEGPEGFSSDKACLKYWADLAHANSYHGKDSHPESDQMKGRTDKNNSGSSFAKGVRRGA